MDNAPVVYLEGESDLVKAQQRERIQKLIDKWVGAIGLRWWHIDFNYLSEIGNGVSESPAMECTARWEYMRAVIGVNIGVIKNMGDEELEYCFVHELMHIFVCEMRHEGQVTPHEERVVTTLAHAMIWAVKHVEKDGDKVDRTATSKSESPVANRKHHKSK